MPPTVAHVGAEEPRDPLARIICIGNSVELITSARLAGHSQPNSPISAPEAELVDITGLSSGNSRDTRRELDIYPPTGKCTSDYKLGWLQLVLQPHDQAPEYGSSDGADDYRDWYLLQVPMKQLEKYRKSSKRRPRARRLRIEKRGEIGCSGKRGPTQARQAVAWLMQYPSASGHPVATILIYAKPDLSNLMQDIPNATPWTEMALAGTHDSAAFYGVPYTQCQKGSITQQLEDGIRYLDLRIKVVGDDLILYHGPVSQRAKFTAILSEIYAFLRAHPSESLLITLKEEIPPNDPNFGRMVWEAIEPGDRAGYWYRQPRVPSLGEVRGKAILMSRFTGGKEWEAGIGWAPAWPNDRKESETELTGDGSMFRLQDWYDIGLGAMQEKADAVTSILATTLTDSLFPTSLAKPPYTLTLSYASGGSIPFAPPCTIACGLGFPSWGMGVWGINHRLADWLLDLIAFDTVGTLKSTPQSVGGSVRRSQTAAGGEARASQEGRLRRIRGILALDFYQDEDGQGSAIVELMTLMNEAGLNRTMGIKAAREEDEEDDLDMEDESEGSQAAIKVREDKGR